MLWRTTELGFPLEEIVAPDVSHIVTEDDTPVDNFQFAQKQRLLVESV